MPLSEQFRGKVLLLTGTTGFLGKVLLQKILISLPDVKTIYILIRSKKGLDLNERFKKQIVSSGCFDRIRDKYGQGFDDFMQKKIIPIQGDLEQQNVGLSKVDYEMIVNTCNVVINCAASIDFNQRIDGAISSNIKGSLRMQQLSKEVLNLDVFTHVSTCYVNCNRFGLIHEQIYESQRDPEEELQQLLETPVSELVTNTSEILGRYPNTYTFTKALCQRLMQKRQGQLRMCIVRPSIINTSYAEPFAGWLDNIAAAAAMFLFVGLGIVREVYGDKTKIGDMVPVDVVANNIIVATAKNFRNNVKGLTGNSLQKLPVYHVGSSDRNPILWSSVQKVLVDFWNSNPATKRLGTAEMYISLHPSLIRLNSLKRQIPSWFYSRMAPWLSKHHQKQAQKMRKTIARGKEIKDVFRFFYENEWIFESKGMVELYEYLNTSQRSEFTVDVAALDMDYFLIINNYGLQKFILKESIERPSPENYNIMKMPRKAAYFPDIQWVLRTRPDSIVKEVTRAQQLRAKVLSSTRILSLINEMAERNTQSRATSIEQEQQRLSTQAQSMVNDLVGEIRLPIIRFLAWMLHKCFRKIYEKVNIDSEMLERLKQESAKGLPLVLMPTHRSYIDFLIVSYVLFLHQQQLPRIVYNEQLMGMSLVPFLVRNCGAFFFRKKDYRDQRLYKEIFDKFLELLLLDGNNLQFFIQGTRSRTGKTLQPQLQIIGSLFHAVSSNRVEDVLLVPITINYEKVLEGDTFPAELLGQEKVAESLLRILKAYPLLKTNFGRVYVEICDPISLKEYIRKETILNEPNKKESSEALSTSNRIKEDAIAVDKLARKIVQRLTEKVVIMSTGIVAMVLLMNRKGMSEDSLVNSVNWISRHIVRKGYRVGSINESSAALAVRNAIQHLQTITTRTKKNIFELQISAGEDFQKLLMLSYYRNTVVHAFLPDAFLTCAACAFGSHLSTKEGVRLPRLHQEAIFLLNLFKEENATRYSLDFDNFFKVVLERMIQDSVFMYKSHGERPDGQTNKETEEKTGKDQTDRNQQSSGQERVVINPKGDRLVMLHLSLLSPLLESYWTTLIFFVSLIRNHQIAKEVNSPDKLFQMIQWQMESMYDQKVIKNYEACSLQTIKNAVITFQRLGLITLKPTTHMNEISVQVLVPAPQLEAFGEKIHFFLKNSYQSSQISPLELAKSTQCSIPQVSRL